MLAILVPVAGSGQSKGVGEEGHQDQYIKNHFRISLVSKRFAVIEHIFNPRKRAFIVQ